MLKPYKNRCIFVFLSFILFFLTAAIKLFFLQIKNHTFLKKIAEKQYTFNITHKPSRGIIYDRNKKPLALNKESVSAFIMPQKLKNPSATKEFLSKNYPCILEKLNKNPKSHFLYIKRNIQENEIDLLKNSQLEDINFLKEPNRFYPFESTAAITGVTNIDNTGICGMELEYNNYLIGSPTLIKIEKDARLKNVYFSKQVKSKGHNGSNIVLTIDGHLQFLVQQELETQAKKFKVKQAAVIIINPVNGDILTMGNYPTFNPNNRESIAIEKTKNYCATQSYEFGSALKVFTALAALEENVVTYDELIDCENTKSAIIDGRRINNWEAQSMLTFQQVIARSNNIGIAKVAKRLNTKLYDHYLNLGFGKKTALSFPGEQKGFINHPKNWSAQSIISLSYGYEIRATLLQLATAFSVFCNNGKIVQPRLVLEKPILKSEKLYSDQSIATMNTILEKTTMQGGTAKSAHVNGFITKGKTSTANLLENGKYNPHKNIYGFVGSVEKGNYKRIIALFLKESEYKNIYASSVAAPLFKNIVERLLLYENISKDIN